MTDKDQLKSERNNHEDVVAEPSGFIVDFSLLDEGGTANGGEHMELTKHDGSKKVCMNTVGKLLVASYANNDDVHVGIITSKPSSISNSSEKLEQKQDIKK